MVMLFLEQVLSWGLFQRELYFSSQAIKEFYFFFLKACSSQQMIKSISPKWEWKEFCSSGMKRNYMNYQQPNNWHPIDFFLGPVLLFQDIPH